MSTQRVSKKEQRKQQVAREKRKKRLLIGIPVLLIVLSITIIGVYRFTRPDILGTLRFSSLTNNHGQATVQEIANHDPNLPPVGGDHSGSSISCEVYNTAVDPLRAIHSLEHGGIWLAYRSDLSSDQVIALSTIARNENSVLMSPYDGLESDVVMTAWGRQMVVDEVPDERVEDFISRYRGLGPEGSIGC